MNASHGHALCLVFVPIGVDILGVYAKRWQETEIGITVANLSMLETKERLMLMLDFCDKRFLSKKDLWQLVITANVFPPTAILHWHHTIHHQRCWQEQCSGAVDSGLRCFRSLVTGRFAGCQGPQLKTWIHRTHRGKLFNWSYSVRMKH